MPELREFDGVQLSIFCWTMHRSGDEIKKLIALIESVAWYFAREGKGSHAIYRHQNRTGTYHAFVIDRILYPYAEAFLTAIREDFAADVEVSHVGRGV
jgi:hypothetical protein